ncbi:hypothetical protein DLM77_08640 [Leptospira yasudae]|uniref:Uncharacterized protein n=1 Tax=Leptospira yasudae TaxID=2202201 RepID=A0ABX9M3X8_9LEPT|nr:hypothetical protein DLM77_08640 [Leptospira yasudae]
MKKPPAPRLVRGALTLPFRKNFESERIRSSRWMAPNVCSSEPLRALPAAGAPKDKILFKSKTESTKNVTLQLTERFWLFLF